MLTLRGHCTSANVCLGHDRAGPHGNSQDWRKKSQEWRDEPETSGLCRTSEVPTEAPGPPTIPGICVDLKWRGNPSGVYKPQVIQATTLFERQTGLVCLGTRKWYICQHRVRLSSLQANQKSYRPGRVYVCSCSKMRPDEHFLFLHVVVLCKSMPQMDFLSKSLLSQSKILLPCITVAPTSFHYQE